MLIQFTPAWQLATVDDWRPVYHLSPAASLRRVGAAWPSVGGAGARLLDGWRFSDRPESDWYLKEVELRDPSQRDPVTGEYQELSVSPADQQRAQQFRETINGERYYRMRHVGEMELAVDSARMEQPSISGLNSCIEPGDVVIRRVGHISAALVSTYHRRHPVDANIAVLRGLPNRQAVWVALCLNQPIYRSYFEQPGAIGSMVRLGLKQLSSMPLAPRPSSFDKLADQFWQQYERLIRADDRLQQLREHVSRWVSDRVPERPLMEHANELQAQYFVARDLGNVLSYAAAEQNRLFRELVEDYRCIPLSRLAEVNPEGPTAKEPVRSIIKIGDIGGQLDIQLADSASHASRWRYHKRPLSPQAVLVSSFVQEPKVGMFTEALPVTTFASEQLVVLNFHRTPGAYALLLETGLVRQQIARLATGTVQRFAHPDQFKQIVVPPIENSIALKWHHHLTEIQQQRSEARRELVKIRNAMQRVFRQVHPELIGHPQGDTLQEDDE